MRWQAIRRSLWQCLWHAGYSRNETRIEERELESIRHHLWHGDIEHGCLLLGWMRNRIETVAESKGRGHSARLEVILRRMHELYCTC